MSILGRETREIQRQYMPGRGSSPASGDGKEIANKLAQTLGQTLAATRKMGENGKEKFNKFMTIH